MALQSELVERVVHMQLTSPNFAEYCVSHVTDPKHQFLFARDDDDSAERRLYIRLLGQKDSQTTAAAVQSSTTGVPHSRVEALWTSLLDYFASMRGVRGPHMPHMFRTETDLAAFLDMLDAAQRDGAAVEGVVQFMLRRLPMTETFLYVLCYLCDLRVHEAQKEMHQRSVIRSENNAGGDLVDTTLQAAGTLLFVVNMLLLKHEELGSPVRYIAAFEAYAQRIVEALSKSAPQNSPVASFVRETVTVWSEGGVFSKAALHRMREALGSASG